MSIELWAARLDRPLTEREAQSALFLLPPERRERLLRLRDPDRRREPLCAYLLLRLALWETLHWRELPEITLTPRGKPRFAAHPEVRFNLSHTSGAVLVGLSDRPVGVDIERVRPVSPRVMRRLAGTEDEAEFFRLWVRREARVKRDGGSAAATLRSETPLRQEESYFALDAFPGYAAGAASSAGESPGGLRRCRLDDLM